MKERLDIILQKISKLIAENNALKTSVELRQNEIEKLENNIKLLTNEKENLQNKNNYHNLAPESLTKKDIKLKIENYIEEIDQCIALLEDK